MKNKELIKQFEKDGILTLKKILNSNEIKKLKKKTLSILNNKNNSTKNGNKINNLKGINAEAQAIHNLHNKGKEYIKLMSKQKILRLVETLLKQSTFMNGEDIICQKSFARNPSFKKKKQILHTDSRFISSTKPLTINVFWLLDDFNKFNGALRYIPGSHKFLKFPNNKKINKKEVKVIAKKGDVIIFDGNLWHGNDKKFKDLDRWVLVFRYAPWFYRPAFLNEYNTPNNIYKLLTKKQKTLLGFKHIPPKDEFERIESRSKNFANPKNYLS